MTEDQRSPEERQTAMVAHALVSKRADGHIESLSDVDAAKLLGCIDSYNAGMGAFNLLVPANKIKELGLNEELWGKASKPVDYKGRTMYDVDYMMGFELISRLSVVSGKTWQEARELKASIDATRADREIK